jgi:hypothetical protein
VPVPVFKLYELDGDLAPGAVLDRLEEIPARLKALAAAASADALEAHHEGEWSAFQACCHMRDAAIVYTARFRWMIFDDDPVLPNYDEDNWVAASRDAVADLPAILGEITASREGLVRVLRRLPPEAWQRTGRHEVIGRVVLEPYVRHELAHEEMHLAQVAAALGRA